MILKGANTDKAFLAEELEDIPTLDDIRLEGGFFQGSDRGEWLRNLEHHLRYGDDLLMIWGEPGVGKSTLLNNLASRLDQGVFTVVAMDAKRGGGAEHLWGALDRKLNLPPGTEGWDQLKRISKKLESSGQTLAIIIDHADKLNKEAVTLALSLVDMRLPECRFLLALDGSDASPHAQWPAFSALLERGQLARVWPFSEEDADAYVDFRLQYAQLNDVNFGDAQKRVVYERSQGNPGAIRTEMQRLLTGAATTGSHLPKSKTKKRATPTSVTPPTGSGVAPKAASSKSKTKKPLVLPKAHTVALSVLALAMLGFYWVWEKPIPASVILTPSPTQQQSLPEVIKPQETVSIPQLTEEPPASGLPTPVKTMLDPVGPTAAGAGSLSAETDPSSGAAPLQETTGFKPQGSLQAPPGFVPSNVPLMAEPLRSRKVESSTLNAGSPAMKSAVASVAPKVPALKPANSKPTLPTVGKATPVAPPATKVKESAGVSVKPAAPKPALPQQVALAQAPTPLAKTPVKQVATPPKPTAPTNPLQAPTKPQGLTKNAPAPSQKTGYTLQIMGLRDQRSVQAFMRQNAGVKGLTYYASTLGGQPWYVIVQGEYPTREAAQVAVKKLPAALQASKPFPKSLNAVQNDPHP